LRAGKFQAVPASGNSGGMDALVLICLIAAAVCFGLAVANLTTRVNLIALGLLFWVITALAPAVQAT
jgi:hypothetical protein